MSITFNEALILSNIEAATMDREAIDAQIKAANQRYLAEYGSGPFTLDEDGEPFAEPAAKVVHQGATVMIEVVTDDNKETDHEYNGFVSEYSVGEDVDGTTLITIRLDTKTFTHDFKVVEVDYKDFL